jgi:hypothetical protein
VDIRNIGCGIDLEETQAAAAPDNLAFIDSTIQNLNSSGGSNCPIGLRLTGSQVAVMGNLFSNSAGGNAEHLARLHWVDRAIISNNTIQQGHNGKEMLSIRAIDSAAGRWGLTGDAIATKYVLVSDNHIKTDQYAGIQTVFSGDGSDRDLWRDILIERNYLQNAPGAGDAIRVLGDRITIRSNIFDLTSGGGAITTDRAYSGIPATRNVAIYNNTIYSGRNGGFTGINLVSGGTGHIVRNNLGYAPNATGPVMITDGTGATKSNNSTDTQVKSSSAMFATTPPTTPAHYRPTCTGTTYPCAIGANVPVWYDFLGTQPATRDIGAMNH